MSFVKLSHHLKKQNGYYLWQLGWGRNRGATIFYQEAEGLLVRMGGPEFFWSGQRGSKGVTRCEGPKFVLPKKGSNFFPNRTTNAFLVQPTG